MPPLMSDEDKNFGGSLALNSGGNGCTRPPGRSTQLLNCKIVNRYKYAASYV